MTEASHKFSVGPISQVFSFIPTLSTIDECRGDNYKIDFLPTITEETPDYPFVAPIIHRAVNFGMNGIKGSYKSVILKEPKEGIDRFVEYRRGRRKYDRVMSKPSTKNKQSLFDTLRHQLENNQYKGLGVNSLYYTSKLTNEVRRKSIKALKAMINYTRLTEEVSDDYMKDYINSSLFSQNGAVDPELGPLLYDCTIHGVRAKAFVDTGAINMPCNPDKVTSSAYVSYAWVKNSGLSVTALSHPFDIMMANDSKVVCKEWLPNSRIKFGPYSERIDLYVFDGSSVFDIVLGRQWWKLRDVHIDNFDDSLLLAKDVRQIKVPITTGSKAVFRKGRYMLLQTSDLEPDKNESEVYHTYTAFERANKRSLEQRTNPQPIFRLKITKNILGHEVDIEDPDPAVLSEFDNPDEEFVIGSSIDKYDPKVPKTRNIAHDFDSIQNVRSPLDEKPITNELMQQVWDTFGPSTEFPEGDTFPQEIQGVDPETGALKGIQIPSITEPLPGHEGTTPIRPVMKLAPDHERELYTQIKYYLDKGWIVPSDSPYGCAVFFVPKKSGKLRIVLDYRPLNSITRKDKFALPDPTHLTSQLAGAKFYSSLDLAHGYHQLVLDEKDRPKTAFRTLHGSYQWNVLTFGLTNAVPAFIKVMESVLREFIGVNCIVFIDDIVIYSKTLEQHKIDVFNVLRAIQKSNLKVNWSKSEILLKEITYLGHKINADGVSPLDDKVNIIRDWPVPDNVYQVRSFLGAVGYYRKFIHNFSKWATPLSNLTKDDPDRESVPDKMVTLAKWGRNVKTKKLKPHEWTPECQTCFEHLKHALVTAPVLKLANPDLDYEVFTDASKNAVGAVLMQRDDNFILHPCAYFSQKLSKTELGYPVHELELLGIFKSLKHWRHYLLNNETLIYTDHKPLTHLLTQQTLSLRQQRWITYLADYKVDIIAIEGTKNVVADALSRYEFHSEALTEASVIIKGMLPEPLTTGSPDKESEHRNMSLVYSLQGFDQVTGYVPYCEPVSLETVALHTRFNSEDVVTPTEASLVDIKKSLQDSYGIDTLCRKIASGVYGNIPYRFVMDEGLIYYKYDERNRVLFIPSCAKTVPKYQVTDQPVEGDDVRISVSLREELIREAHEVAGHVGASKVYSSLRRYFYWPRMQKHVTSFVRGCLQCQSNKHTSRSISGKLRSLQLPHSRWEKISMDWITKLPLTKSGFDSILVVVDYFSKRAHFIPTRDDSTSKQTAHLFYNIIFRYHGLPREIISDRDRRFTSGFWKSLASLIGTNLAMSTPYHPQTDGATEVVNRTIGGMLRQYTQNALYDWDEYLTAAEFSYNNSVHRSTGFSPFSLDLGQDPLDSLSKAYVDIVMPENHVPITNNFTAEVEAMLLDWREKLLMAKANLEDSQHYAATLYDKSNPVDFKEGDQVWLDTSDLTFYSKKGVKRKRSKFDPRFSGPYTIVKVIGDGTAFELDLGPKERFHPVQSIMKLRPFRLSTEFPSAHIYDPPVTVSATDDSDASEQMFEVQYIRGKRKFGNVWKYLVKWKGYAARHNTWEPASELVSICQEEIDNFNATLNYYL